MIELRVLGALELRAENGRELHSLLAQPKRVALLAYLCLATPHGFHRRDTLLGLLWPDADQSHARNSLRNALHVLRRSLGEQAIAVRGAEEVGVDDRIVACDAVAFTRASQQGAVDEAVRLYGGDLLPGFFLDDVPEFERWLESERARLRDMAIRATRLFADRLAASGNPSGAVQAARRAVEMADSGEREIRRLIELLVQLGDRAGALRAYSAFAGRLAAEYGTAPSAETRVLIERIRAEQSIASPTAPSTPRGTTSPTQASHGADVTSFTAPGAAALQPQPGGSGAPRVDGYAIERELGRGGMATVYRARDLHTGRDVAIKFLRPDLAPVIGTARFLGEIDIARRLHHPRILPLLDSGSADGLPYYVMPYATGETLRERIRREHRLEVDEALRITREVADALDYAHALGIIHRDVKPENVLLDDRHALVADFGLAHALSSAGGQALTQSGIVIGTPAYTSPEVATSDAAPSARSDVYALGCVLYEMLAGDPPFTGSSAQAVLARKAAEPAPSLRTVRETVSPALERVVLKALARSPSDRFASAGELAAAASAAASRHQPPVRPRRTAIAAAAVVLLLGASILAHRGASPAAQPLVTRRQLTFDGHPIMATISPAGDFLAYSVPAGDSERVVVQDMTGGTPRPVIVLPEVYTIEWSPDGTQLLIGSTNRSVIVPRAGGAPRTIPLPPRFEIVIHAYWLPDGQHVSVHGNMSRRIMVIDLRTGDTVPVPVRDHMALYGGAWSPDGHVIALATRDSAGWRIRVMDRDGRTTVAASDSVELHSPRWSARGDALFFARLGESIWRVAMSPDAHVVEGQPREIHRYMEMLPNTADDPGFSLGRGGTWMVYSRGVRFSNLWMVARGPRESARQPVPLTRGTVRRWAPAVSPDGRWIAFAQAEGRLGDLYRMPIAGDSAVRITFGAGIGGESIAWSPDGGSIAYVAYEHGSQRLMIADVATGRTHDAGASEGSGNTIAWAPESRIAYQPITNGNVILLDPDTHAERRLHDTDTTGFFFSPSWSADGSHLAVAANHRGGDFGVDVLDARTMSSVRTPTPVSFLFPRGWSADGRYVYAIGRRGMYEIDARGGRSVRRIFTLPWRTPDCMAAGPHLPDAFVCSASDYTSDVWLIENFDAGAADAPSGPN